MKKTQTRGIAVAWKIPLFTNEVASTENNVYTRDLK
jgi:hypothetical protein